MNKLHSFAFYALVTPAITLGAGSVLAEKSADQDAEREQQSTQRDQGTGQSASDQGKQSAKQSDSNPAVESAERDESRTKNQGYMGSAPANGMQASNLIGAEVKTSADEDVGSVSDLIIDENGQVAAIVVGVGGFLGMGEKNVAIGWDEVKRSGESDEQELRINMTREELRSAPKFEMQD